MNNNQILNGGINIPADDLTETQQLQLYNNTITESHTSNSQRTVLNNQSNNDYRRSTNSVSSLSNASPHLRGVLAHNRQDETESISKVIDICNDIDAEHYCNATETLVRKCIKNEIWRTNKFMTDTTVKHMKIDNRTNSRSVLNVLLKYTRKNNFNNLDRLRFWKKYSALVQHDLNLLKTVCTKGIKDEIMIGELFVYKFKCFCLNRF